MGIFDRFPYSSTHEMNLDFMLGKATEIAEDMQQVTAGMEQVQAGLSAISEKTEQATQAAAQAAASASSIEGSVTAAEEAAEEAQMHNESAQTWANNAMTYKADCQRAATEAAASSSSAAQAATAAAASEDTVATYAQAANASAQSAANNNDSAHQYANQASASASNATFHSSNAQTAATNANTSATNAETAATNAQTAATRAATLKDDVETLHRMCVTAVDQAATEAVNAANSAAQAAATKTDVETLVESLPEDFTDLNNTVNQLSDDIVDIKSAIKLQETGKIKLESGTFTDATGTEKTANTARCRNVSPIPLEDFVSISMPDGYSMYIFLLDYNLQKIGVLTWSTYRTKLDFGNAFYINIAIRNTSSPSTSIVDYISTIESEIVIRNDFNQLQTQVDDISDDLYEQTVLLSDSLLHAFPVSNGTNIVITTADGTTLPEGNPYLQFYDSNKTYLNQFLCSSEYGTSRTVTVTFGNVAFVKMYATPSKTIKVYIPDKNKLIPKVNEIAKAVGQDTIIVDASGSGDYTSFTQAIYETVDSGRDVLVKPGTYDIVAEYVALFGQTAVDNMADADSAIFNGFQYGVRLRNRKVEFDSGAHLVCDWTGHTVNGTHRFSALGIDYDVEIIGLDLDVTATFYCIHDDYGPDGGIPYTVKYENCRVVGHSIYNANCIGGGCKKYSRHILKNCYFDNNLTGSATVRYHNTIGEGAEPEIYVSNCYFNNWFTPRWYGTQTSKMRVYVNNCHARAIYKMAESSSYDVDNVELYKWNNEETDPIT